MTLIEIADREPLANILGILTLMPDNAVFIGCEPSVKQDVARIQTVLTMQKRSIAIETHVVDPLDIQAVRDTIEAVVKNHPDCVVDLTGGDERLVAAAASVAEQYGLQAQYIDSTTNALVDMDGDGKTANATTPSLTVPELIVLHGGKATGYTDAPTCPKHEVDKFWHMTRHRSREWNSNTKRLMTLEKGHYRGGTVSFPLHDVPPHNHERIQTTLAKLHDRGIIQNNSTTRDIRYTYLQPCYRLLFEKAGNTLEHKAFYEAKQTSLNGKPLFDHVCMGVSIDWDGHEPKATNNEIDLLMTRGVNPIFVSCKNGDVDENELYKLATVAERFGGRFAKKMLIVTDLEPDSEQARDAFARRAADMGIYLVANAGDLPDDAWQQEFLNAMGLE